MMLPLLSVKRSFVAVVFPTTVRRDEAHEERREVAEDLNLALVRLHRLLPERKRGFGGGEGFGQPETDAFRGPRLSPLRTPPGTAHAG